MKRGIFMYFCTLDSLQEFCYFCNFWSTHPSLNILLQFSQYNGYVGEVNPCTCLVNEFQTLKNNQQQF